MFCLQCGNAVAPKRGVDLKEPDLLETTDPLLQRAIVEASGHEIQFQLPHSNVPPPTPASAMTTMKAVLGSPRPVLAVAGAGSLSVPAGAAPERKTSERGEPAKVSKKTRLSDLNLALLKVPGPRSAAPTWLNLKISPAYMVGAVAFAAFVLANAGIYGAYAGKIYPGVKVDGVVIGGARFDEVAAKVGGLSKNSRLSAEIGTQAVQLDTTGLAQTDVGRIEREAEQIGHNTPLPLAGLIEAQFSKPIHAQMNFNQTALDKIVTGLKSQFDLAQSDAVPVVYNGQAFVVSDKSGVQLDAGKLAGDIKQAYGSEKTFQIKTDKIVANITTSSYANDVQDAQTILSLNLHFQVGKNSFTPTPAQIGSWLGFGAPGKGVVIDQTGVAAYVNSWPGSFDKDATTKALLAAIQAKQSVNYKAASKPTLIPSYPASVALPVKTYSFCLNTDQSSDFEGFKESVVSALAQSPGWTLGGKLAFKPVASGCNFSFGLESEATMAALDPVCKGVASCTSGSNLAMSRANWVKPPAAWTSTSSAYQSELVNHELGHWLGFEHVSCTVANTSQPVLSQPTVTLGGCSPQWYEIPTEVQGTKKLGQL
jgi:hypothetical protein